MNAKKFCLLIGIILILGLLPQGNVSADMGPKPTFEFLFEQEAPGPKLELTTWQLIKCGDRDCLDTQNYEVYDGEMFFNCVENVCKGFINPTFVDDTDSSFQLEATFSDGKTRKSNIFKKTYYDARYKVVIQFNSLGVSEIRGSNSSLYVIKLVETSCIWVPGCFLAITAMLIIFVIKRERVSITEKGQSPKFSRLLWGGIIVFTLLGLISSPITFILTLIIESVLAIAYLKIAKTPLRKILYGILIANIFTQPVFTIVLRNLNMVDDAMKHLNLTFDFTIVVVFEIIIWLVETAIVNKMQDKQIPLKNIAILTFVLNIVSFGVGMFPTYYVLRAFV